MVRLMTSAMMAVFLLVMIAVNTETRDNIVNKDVIRDITVLVFCLVKFSGYYMMAEKAHVGQSQGQVWAS